MKKIVHSMLAFTVLLAGCGGDDSEAPPTLPFNLQMTVDVSNDGSGLVSVAATAADVNFYTVYFGESAGETPVTTTNGEATHTYEASGTYTIRVQAHATPNAFVSKTQDVTITLKDDGTWIPETGYTTPLSYDGMTLVWNDEFDGNALSSTNWTFEIGTGSNGWGNNELQYYRQENTEVSDGYLIITAKKQSFQGSNYTSSRIITKDKKAFQYGRVDIRAVLPKGQGIWPALWMLGSNISTVPWPACGEIDIMEMIGGSGREKTVHGTAHWDNAGAHASYGNDYTLGGGIFADEFHVFSMVWTATSIKWYVDDVKFNEIDITPAGLSELKNPAFFIFNVAVGGDWPQAPDATTTFPQHMVVDYIRMFQPE